MSTWQTSESGGPALRTVEVLISGPRGAKGEPGLPGSGGGSSALLSLKAGQALGGHRVVRLRNDRLVYATAAALEDANLIVGLTAHAALAGDDVAVQNTGPMTEPSWAWTPDKPVFCGHDGSLTQVPPTSGFTAIVGIASTPTTILIGIKLPIVTLE